MRFFSESITQNLLDEYPDSIYGDYFDCDLTEISALKVDDYQEAKKAELLYKAGIIDRAEAKRMVGYDYNPTDEQIYHPEATPIPTESRNKLED